MGNREPGLAGAVAKLREELADADSETGLPGFVAVDAGSLAEVLEAVRDTATISFVRNFVDREQYDRITDDEYLAFAAKVSELYGGPAGPPPPSLAELAKAVDGLKLTPWSGDNTYGQAVDDAVGVLRATFSGTKYAPPWNRCTKMRKLSQCLLQLPHETHRNGNGETWAD